MNDEPLSPRVQQAALQARQAVPVDAAAIARVRAALGRGRGQRFELSGYRLAAALALVLVIGFAAGLVTNRTAPPQPNRVAMSFVLAAPTAKRVALVGDFNDWNDRVTPMQRGSDGAWTVQVELVPGNYSYAFVVNDSTWYSDPRAPVLAQDDFGRPSSVVLVRRRT